MALWAPRGLTPTRPFTQGPQVSLYPLSFQDPPGCKDQNSLTSAQAKEGHCGRVGQGAEPRPGGQGGGSQGTGLGGQERRRCPQPGLQTRWGANALVGSVPTRPLSCAAGSVAGEEIRPGDTSMLTRGPGRTARAWP